jgi:hypothetical protein
MSVDVKYRTTATARGGRDGTARTEDGTFEVKLATPKELGGAGGEGNNPEQLFAAGYAACFIGAMKVAAGGLKLRVPRRSPSPRRSASALVPRADSASTSSCGCTCPASIALTLSGWSRRPTRSAPIPTRPATTSTSGSRPSDARKRARPGHCLTDPREEAAAQARRRRRARPRGFLPEWRPPEIDSDESDIMLRCRRPKPP